MSSQKKSYVSSIRRKSFISSFHLQFSFPNIRCVLILSLRSGFHSAHLSFFIVANLIFSLHFIFLCISTHFLHFSPVRLLLQCFSLCNRSILLRVGFFICVAVLITIRVRFFFVFFLCFIIFFFFSSSSFSVFFFFVCFLFVQSGGNILCCVDWIFHVVLIVSKYRKREHHVEESWSLCCKR